MEESETTAETFFGQEIDTPVEVDLNAAGSQVDEDHELPSGFSDSFLEEPTPLEAVSVIDALPEAENGTIVELTPLLRPLSGEEASELLNPTFAVPVAPPNEDFVNPDDVPSSVDASHFQLQPLDENYSETIPHSTHDQEYQIDDAYEASLPPTRSPSPPPLSPSFEPFFPDEEEVGAVAENLGFGLDESFERDAGASVNEDGLDLEDQRGDAASNVDYFEEQHAPDFGDLSPVGAEDSVGAPGDDSGHGAWGAGPYGQDERNLPFGGVSSSEKPKKTGKRAKKDVPIVEIAEKDDSAFAELLSGSQCFKMNNKAFDPIVWMYAQKSRTGEKKDRRRLNEALLHTSREEFKKHWEYCVDLVAAGRGCAFPAIEEELDMTIHLMKTKGILPGPKNKPKVDPAIVAKHLDECIEAVATGKDMISEDFKTLNLLTGFPAPISDSDDSGVAPSPNQVEVEKKPPARAQPAKKKAPKKAPVAAESNPDPENVPEESSEPLKAKSSKTDSKKKPASKSKKGPSAAEVRHLYGNSSTPKGANSKRVPSGTFNRETPRQHVTSPLFTILKQHPSAMSAPKKEPSTRKKAGPKKAPVAAKGNTVESGKRAQTKKAGKGKQAEQKKAEENKRSRTFSSSSSSSLSSLLSLSDSSDDEVMKKFKAEGGGKKKSGSKKKLLVKTAQWKRTPAKKEKAAKKAGKKQEEKKTSSKGILEKPTGPPKLAASRSQKKKVAVEKPVAPAEVQEPPEDTVEEPPNTTEALQQNPSTVEKRRASRSKSPSGPTPMASSSPYASDAGPCSQSTEADPDSGDEVASSKTKNSGSEESSDDEAYRKRRFVKRRKKKRKIGQQHSSCDGVVETWDQHGVATAWGQQQPDGRRHQRPLTIQDRLDLLLEQEQSERAAKQQQQQGLVQQRQPAPKQQRQPSQQQRPVQQQQPLKPVQQQQRQRPVPREQVHKPVKKPRPVQQEEEIEIVELDQDEPEVCEQMQSPVHLPVQEEDHEQSYAPVQQQEPVQQPVRQQVQRPVQQQLPQPVQQQLQGPVQRQSSVEQWLEQHPGQEYGMQQAQDRSYQGQGQHPAQHHPQRALPGNQVPGQQQNQYHEGARYQEPVWHSAQMSHGLQEEPVPQQQWDLQSHPEPRQAHSSRQTYQDPLSDAYSDVDHWQQPLEQSRRPVQHAVAYSNQPASHRSGSVAPQAHHHAPPRSTSSRPPPPLLRVAPPQRVPPPLSPYSHYPGRPDRAALAEALDPATSQVLTEEDWQNLEAFAMARAEKLRRRELRHAAKRHGHSRRQSLVAYQDEDLAFNPPPSQHSSQYYASSQSGRPEACGELERPLSLARRPHREASVAVENYVEDGHGWQEHAVHQGMPPALDQHRHAYSARMAPMVGGYPGDVPVGGYDGLASSGSANVRSSYSRAYPDADMREQPFESDLDSIVEVMSVRPSSIRSHRRSNHRGNVPEDSTSYRSSKRRRLANYPHDLNLPGPSPVIDLTTEY